MNLTFIPGKNITLITSDFKVFTAAKDNPNWKAIEAAVKCNNEAELIKLISLKECIRGFGNTNQIEIDPNKNKIFYRGQELFGKDVERILSFIQNGFPSASMVKFLEAKLKNPSPASVTALYMFLENKGMPTTDNGTVLGYKGVRPDYNSVNTGSEPLISGTRNQDGSICNKIGETIWMNREYVCADNGQACAAGLHIGSQDYARGWAGNGHLMVVEFSPADVISVPTMEHEKLRVCKYRVVGELKNDVLGETYNNDYVRPDDSPDPDSFGYVEDVEDVEGNTIGVVETDNVNSNIMKNYSSSSDFARGHSEGFKDGKGHRTRGFYEVDRGTVYKNWSSDFVNGYLTGYKDGRII